MGERDSKYVREIERRAGEMLAGLEKHNGDPCDTLSLRLSDLGIERHQSSRWEGGRNR